MSTILDYAERRVDLLAWQGFADTPPGVEVLLVPALATPTEGGRIVAGIEKRAQEFLRLLLMQQGTVAYAPAEGCRFMSDAAAGRWRTVADVEESFAFSLVDIRRQLLATQADDDPADERFLDAQLQNVVLDGSRVAISILYQSEAADVTLLVPLTVSIA